MHIDQLSSRARKFFDKIEFDEKEQLLAEIRKHPFGLVLIYITGGLIALMLFALLVVSPLVFSSESLGFVDTPASRSIIVILGFALSLVAIVGVAVGAFLYQGNVIIVTSEKLAQQLNTSLFDRKISQLSIGDVQDVTVSQKGIFARIFNYGTLVIETAGEQINYVFTFTPDPYQTAKTIVGAHERNLQQYGN
jgi:hypothetical protein